MPRAKTKQGCSSHASKKLENRENKLNRNSTDDNESVNVGDCPIKTEPPELSEKQLSASKIDLSQFKFEKKPHIKIEYEKTSPVKEEGKGLWEPANWKEFLVNLRIMRSNNDAPVDTMGCHMSMDRYASPEIYRYQCLISLMLSSQTKDQVTFAAMERLKARGLTVDSVLSMSDDELGQLIYPVGFWKTKVQYIKKTTQILKEQYKGDIPDSVDKLCKLRGVGPKMAHICMLVAWDKVTGIGVDTHVHRISNRIGWVKKPTSTPEDTRKALETWLPFDLWKEVNHLLVGFGQTICLPIGPTCHECLNRDICPSSGKVRKSPMKNIKQELKAEKSDSEKEDKPVKNKKVTPRKELNEHKQQDSEKKDGNLAKLSPKTEKMTTKKDVMDEKVQIAENLCVINEAESRKSPRKRKVTPKKEIKSENGQDDEMDDFEVKSENLNILPKTKKNVTSKKVNNKVIANDMKAGTENFNQEKLIRSTKYVGVPNFHEDSDFKEPSTKTTKRNNELKMKENDSENNSKYKKPLAQKRSPRNKITNQVADDAETSGNSNALKRTRGAKK